jgi:maltose alpha-D-glucosyltransferase/alpha-amylase
VQDTIWSYDRRAKSWYYRRFYDFQPDLNVANPAVRDEINKVMGFWLQMGVSGFRVDAVPFLIELKGPETEEGLKDFTYLEDFRQFLSWRSGEAIVMGEANVALHELLDYFDRGGRMQMLLNFMANQNLFNAFAQENATPLMRALQSLPKLPQIGQWGTFLRNHDEIDLGRLTEAERRLAFARFGPDPDMQLYDRGVRRRLAPMLGNDSRLLRPAYSLLFTLPGTPVLRYGEEIGMGDDLSLPERYCIRTPMQWSEEPNGGFSPAPANKLPRPVISGGEYGFERVNIELERRDPDSLLNHVERMIRLRKEHPEFVWGEWSVVESGEPSIFALRARWQERDMVAVHNFAGRPCKFTLTLPGVEAKQLIDVISGEHFARQPDGRCALDLDAYAYRWLRFARLDDGG